MTRSAEDFNESVVIILVEPQHSGNVGAVARAMKNMGLDQLRLVVPGSFDPMRAQWMSPGCEDVLRNAKFIGSLEEALQGVHRVVASTARHRKNRQSVHTPSELAEQICNAPVGHVTGILFGREDYGLSKEAVQAAESIVQIPTAPHASLNLSQAVMVIAHELFQAFRKDSEIHTGRLIHGRRGVVATSSLQTETHRDQKADWTAMESAVTALVHLLDDVGYTRHTASERVALSVRQILQQTNPSLRQIDIFRGMIRRIGWALDNPDEDWQAKSPNSSDTA